ncbi:DUF1206 domain-containing protein [Salinisphaera hydrothermalis]|uniref:DUF1206 domain-containing protein n=1 Tax=Salinisphaera hydrothermalis (strain C41B8) TaxID=1304275 RepID=A0A084IM57_SALHC|nr:DUF1206 domain-containing protein [Salinisphaera hydrothermalis]KEZ77791.1 hypothetical protein C41B8_08245 [Salinisphaera hydrothermalis C41B8]
MKWTRTTVRWLARVGYAARGLVYLVFGGLALHAAWELSEAEDVRGSLKAIHQEPGGALVLLALAAGLAAYGAWRLVQSTLDVDHHGWGPKALAVRGGLLVSAFSHASLAWAGIKISMDWSSGSSQPVQHAVSATFDWPYGRELVAVLGIVIIGAGVAHLHKAAVAGFRKWFDAWPGAMWWIDPVSRIGLSARGLLFLGIGGFVIYSAITLDPSDAKGVQGLLVWVQQHGYGRIVLAVWAVGVMLFGCYSLIEAFVRRVGLGAKV